MSNINALLLGLSPELVAELLAPLKSCAVTAKVVDGVRDVAGSFTGIIFCGAEVDLVAELRLAKPQAAIVVVSRHPEVQRHSAISRDATIRRESTAQVSRADQGKEDVAE